jgi:restriction system protein
MSTIGYGLDAFEFAKNKPIELMDGGGLLYLLEEQGIRARIVFPPTAEPLASQNPSSAP